jgi:hypothetical protein
MSRQVQLSESCEGADGYRGTLVRLSEHCRIVICRDAKQWVVQTRDGQRAGAARWTGRGYAQTQEGLLRVLRHLQRLSEEAEAKIRGSFPQHIRQNSEQYSQS